MRITDAGRVVMAGFPGPVVDDHVREALRLGVGGFILFTRNLVDAEQARELIAELRGLAAGRRLLLAVDQEGGRVARLPVPCTIWPTMRELGRAGDETLARQFGEAMGRELRTIGFDLDFAPVMDVDTNPDNPVIGDRSLGNKAETVGRLGAAIIHGLQGAGVMACAKHFPGHGDTEVDSHHDLPVVPHDYERLLKVELPPFREAVRADVAAMMTAHLLVEHVDDQNPATMSAAVLSILRRELDYDGLVVTDDLEMKAVADRYDLGQAAVKAARAGADLMLVCHSLEKAENVVRGIFDARTAGLLPFARLDEMHRRLDRLAARYPEPARGDFAVLGCDEHQRLSERICNSAGQSEGTN